MQGKSLVIYSKFSNLHFFGILELGMTDFWNFWSILSKFHQIGMIPWERSETRYTHDSFVFTKYIIYLKAD